MEAVLFGDLLLVERSLSVLLIGEDEDGHIFQVLHRGKGYLVDDDLKEFGFGDDFALDVGAVDDEDDGIGAGVVGRPHATDALLSAQVPRTELDIFMGDFLNVAADCGGGLDCLSERPAWRVAYIW
jgi:hypothetical protein